MAGSVLLAIINLLEPKITVSLGSRSASEKQQGELMR